MIERLRHLVLVRHRHNWIQLAKFCIVGGSGYIVNLIVFAALVGSHGAANQVVLSLGVSDFNIRWYHVYSMIAFLIANLNNYVLNRMWTFRSAGASTPREEYLPFLTIGLAVQGLTLLVLTVCYRGFDIPLIASQAIAILVVTPVSFLANKFWTFRAIRGRVDGPANDPGTPGDDE
jgi:putative flippase GtrA